MIYPHVLNGVGKWYGVQEIRQPALFMNPSAAIADPPLRTSSFVVRET